MPSAQAYGFGPGARLSSRRDFQKVFADGRKVAGRRLILFFRGRIPGEGQARLGLSVGARVGGAVLRNRLKRLTREAFRLNRSRLKAGQDMVVYLRPGCRWPDLESAERDLLDLCRKAGLLSA